MAYCEDTYWHRLTSLRVGLGRVRLITVNTAADVIEAIHDAGKLVAIGNGTNVIGADDDEAAVAVRLEPEGQFSVDAEARTVCLHAGLSLATALRRCARAGLGGLSKLSGIPGSVGGALAMNAGALGVEIGGVVRGMHGVSLMTGEPWHWRDGDGGWGYRQSPVPDGVLLLYCEMALSEVDTDLELAGIDAEQRRRVECNPQGHSAGSVFRNPEDGLPPAGRLLEDCGCKGLEAGKLQVSERHANWIMNPSGEPASAADARRLTDEMRHRVQERYGITLYTEWRWVGRDFGM